MRLAPLVACVALAGCAYPEFGFASVDSMVPIEDTFVAVDTTTVLDTTMELDSSVVETENETAANDTSVVDTAMTVDTKVVVDTAPEAIVDAPPPVMVTLLSRGSTWRYLDDGTAPSSTNWRGGGGFDDSKWQSGLAQLGFGDGDEKTVIGPPPVLIDAGPDADATLGPPPIVTCYFRRFFTVTGAADYDQLTIRILRDDGAVVYLNGSEVVRTNMPGGTVSYGTFASSAISGADEDLFHTFTVPAATLKEGSNVIAVEVHQSSGGSSDISFDLELIGRKP